jgi:adenylate cyclase
VRKLDKVAVYGRMGGTAIYELVGLDGEPVPAWVTAYEDGLASYLWGDFSTAISHFDKANRLRPGGDAPSVMLIERCRGFLEKPPPSNWDGTTALRSK